MMYSPIKTTYDELPVDLKPLVDKSKFIKAYSLDPGEKVIVWVLDDAIGNSREVEFSTRERRVLSRAEREKKIPPPEEIKFRDPRFHVVKSYELEAKTDVLCERYVISNKSTGQKVTECSQTYYVPFHDDVDTLVSAALEKATFPQTYQNRSRAKKVGYWTWDLYRARRSVGEQGLDEENAFGPDLVVDMKKIEANIEALLPDIIRQLARIEGGKADDMAASFNRKTGLSITL